MAQSYVVELWANAGTMLGGVKRTVLSRFASPSDAEAYRYAAVEENWKAGCNISSAVRPSDLKPEIPDGWASA